MDHLGRLLRGRFMRVVGPASPSLHPYSAVVRTPEMDGLVRMEMGVAENGGGSSRVPVTLDIKALTYTLGRQRILDNVTASCLPGCFTAIMGSSGAGKTSLLHTIVSDSKGKVSGTVTFNGRTLDDLGHRLRRRYALIPQEDTLLPSQTPREALTFAARLRLPPSSGCVRARVDAVLEQLSLTHCADRKVGDVNSRGISGGERRRVSIALELLTRPSLLLFDEPTSGLDSKTAEDVISVLKQLARDGLTVICSIHQPSAQAFAAFDRVLILSHGAVVFEGSPDTARCYFSSVLGCHMAKDSNPADIIMRALKPERGAALAASPTLTDVSITESEREVEEKDMNAVQGTPTDRLKLLWEGWRKAQEYTSETGKGEVVCATPDLRTIPVEPPVAAWRQVVVLLHRQLLDSVKDKQKFASGFSIKVVISLLIGLVWLEQYGTTQDSLYPVSSALFVSLTLWVIDTVFRTTTSFPCSRTLLSREYRNGWYGLGACYTATLLGHVLVNAVYASVCSVPIYFLLGIPMSTHKLAGFVGVNVLLTVVGATMGLAVGSICKDYQSAQSLVMPTILPCLLFSGFLVPYKKLNAIFQWCYFISPFSHALNALQVVVYRDVVFTDCASKVMHCFPTGEDYLAAINAPSHRLHENLVILVGVWLGICLVGFVCMRRLVCVKTH